MQTFVPYESHADTASVLDDKRLFKQIVECKQILLSLLEGGGWANHPAVKMWRGHEPALIHYACVLAAEWETRGWLKNGRPYKQSFTTWIDELDIPHDGPLPYWWGGPIHFTHQLKLTWKLPEWYESRFQLMSPRVEPNYFWPVIN